jgi:antitoxin VapB
MVLIRALEPRDGIPIMQRNRQIERLRPATLGRPPSRLRIFAAGLCSRICLERGRATERHVKLFRDGRNQAVRIPREFELPGTDAIMRKEGDRLILEPAPKHSIDRLLAVLATLEDLPQDEQLPEIEDPPPEPFDL